MRKKNSIVLCYFRKENRAFYFETLVFSKFCISLLLCITLVDLYVACLLLPVSLLV